MKIILIDDEKPLLDLLESKIDELTNATVIGKYTNPHHGLFEVMKQQPDTVFLDISMPELDGINLAKEIKASHPHIKIVFITAFEEHAVDAFEIGVEDYILKPIDNERLLHTFSRLTNKPIPKKENEPKLLISCFQNLQFHNNDTNRSVINIKWRTSRSREVFAYLLHNRGRQVRKDVLVDLIWPNEDVKQAYTQLYSAIYQIRNSFKDSDFQINIISADNSYSIELINCTTDVDLFESKIDEIPFITKDNIQYHKNLLKIYGGDYFIEEDFSWAINERNRLHIKWFNHVLRVAEYYTLTENYPEAILVYLQLQKISPFQDESYFALMKLYNQLDDRISVENQFNSLKSMLLDEFNEEPSLEILNWYNNWKEKQS